MTAAPIQNYPWQLSGFHAHANDINYPTWCAACKIQINPGEKCRPTEYYWVCDQEKCYGFIAHCETVPFEGPRYYDQLYQHSLFLERQARQRNTGFEYLTWLEWCIDQGQMILHKGKIGYVSTYLDVHGKSPDQFRPPTQMEAT